MIYKSVSIAKHIQYIDDGNVLDISFRIVTPPDIGTTDGVLPSTRRLSIIIFGVGPLARAVMAYSTQIKCEFIGVSS
jgi:hypothetical protein